MIVIQHRNSSVSVTVERVHLADFKEFEELVNYKVKFEGPVDLLLDLREMADFARWMWRGRTSLSARAHPNDFKRIAVVTAKSVGGVECVVVTHLR